MTLLAKEVNDTVLRYPYSVPNSVRAICALSFSVSARYFSPFIYFSLYNHPSLEKVFFISTLIASTRL
jgi:hypothetical protein